MHRIDTPGAVSGQFVSGNPFASGGGVEGTILGPAWANAVQEEIAGVVENEGLTLDKQDNGQLLAALELLVDRLVGRRFTFTTPEDLTAGDGYQHRDVFGVVESSVLNGQTATLLVRGRFSITKAAADSITKGDLLRWDQTSREVTTQTGGGSFPVIGYADSTISGAGSALVVLQGPPNAT